MSLFGEVRFTRAYYHGCGCPRGGGVHPADGRWGLDGRAATAAVRELTTLSGTLVSFAQSRFVLQKLAGLALSEATIRRITEDAGEAIVASRERGEEDPPAEPFEWSRDRQGKLCGCASLDGVHVPRQGPRGAKAESRVATIGRVWEMTVENPDQSARRRLVGAFSLDEAARSLAQQAHRVGGDRVEQWILPSDAGAGLETRLSTTFPFSTWVLDFYHAQEHLRIVAGVRFGDPAAAATEHARLRSLLRHEGGAALLADLGADLNLNDDAAAFALSPASAEAFRVERNYFAKHQHGLDYPGYEARGWPLGSGPMESGCKEVVAARMKGSGRRWGDRGAAAVLALRLDFCNGPRTWNARWERFQHN